MRVMVLVSFLVAVTLSVSAEAQQPVGSFEDLWSRVKSGDTVYVTDASGKNRWSRLPEYWEAEVQAIHRINQRQAP